MKTLIKIKNKFIRGLKIAILIWTTSIGFCATYLGIGYSLGLITDIYSLAAALLLTLFSEIIFIGCIAE